MKLSKGMKATKGSSATARLEKKKRGCISKTGGRHKRPHFVDALFSTLPLQDKGDSKDVVVEERSPIAAAPISAVRRTVNPLTLDLSDQEVESNDKAEPNVVVDSPAPVARPHGIISTKVVLSPMI